MSRTLLAASLVILVVIIIASWSIIQKSSTATQFTTQTTLTTSPILVEKTFGNDAFEAKVLYPKEVKPGQEITIKIYAEAKNDYVLSGIVIKVYPHTLLPGPTGPIFGEKYEVIYEDSSELSQPVKSFSKEYRIKLPEDLEGLGLSIFITPIKPGEPILVHFSEPIIINVEVKGITPTTHMVTETLSIITTCIELPPRPWSNLSISTDKEVYEVGEGVRITLTNKGDKVVRIKPSIPWVICPYSLEENRISHFCIYEPPRDDKWIILSSGSSITWVWNQTSTWDSVVEPGHYTVVLGDDIVIEVDDESIRIPGIIEDINAIFTIVKG